MSDLPKVIPCEERMVFSVQSATKPNQQYRCDLLANGGYGFCSCVDFGTRRQPAIDAGELMGTRKVMCKHIHLARRAFLNDLLVTLAHNETHPPKK